MAFEWIAEHFTVEHQLCFILLGSPQSALKEYLETRQVPAQSIRIATRIHWLVGFIKIVGQLIMTRPEVVHTHLPKANLIGLSAAWLLFIKKRVYTRHHSIVHHRENRKGFWIDRWCNFIATDIVSISRNVSYILKALEKVPDRKIRLIHHGFDLKYFGTVNSEMVDLLRRKYNIIKGWHPIIGTVSRYVEWKGIQYIIPAFRMILEKYPNAHLILANTHGPYGDEITHMLSQLPVNSYTEILHEDDPSSLFRLFDVYLHVPVDELSEAFGQTYVEALASGIPSIFTLSGVAPEFIRHEQNALVVPFRDSLSIYDAILRIVGDWQLKNLLIINGKKSAQLFALNKMLYEMEKLYEIKRSTSSTPMIK